MDMLDDTFTLAFAFVIIIILSAVFGLVGRACAKSRGRQTAGFWLGFFLGPLGCLIALFLPVAAPLHSRPPPGKNCPMCGRRAGVYDSKCPACGSAL